MMSALSRGWDTCMMSWLFDNAVEMSDVLCRNILVIMCKSVTVSIVAVVVANVYLVMLDFVHAKYSFQGVLQPNHDCYSVLTSCFTETHKTVNMSLHTTSPDNLRPSTLLYQWRDEMTWWTWRYRASKLNHGILPDHRRGGKKLSFELVFAQISHGILPSYQKVCTE